MDTGLYFGIRFYDWDSDLPELTDNRDECKDYIHSEYVNTSPDRDTLLPFCFLIPGTGLNVALHTVSLKIVFDDEANTEVGIGTNPLDWFWEEYEGNTYVFYKATNIIYADGDIHCGKYYLKLLFMLGSGFGAKSNVKQYYSDRFIIPRNIAASDIPNYKITYSVIGGNGTLKASVGGVEFASGASRWVGSDVKFLATPNEGYCVKEWICNDIVVDWATTNEYGIILTEAIVVTVEFKQIVYSSEYSDEYLK